jgi:hypothetical protein
MGLDPADIRAIAVEVAAVLEERGLVQPAEPKLLSAAEVARRLGRSRDWVYEHADDLGVVRLGDGPRARLAFSTDRLDAFVTRRPARDGSDREKPAPDRARRRRRRDKRRSDVRLLPVGGREKG